MLKTLLTTGALAATLALGAGPAAVFAQTTPPASDPATPEPEAPGTMAPAPVPDAATPDTATAPDASVGIGNELASIPRDELIGADITSGPDHQTVAMVEDVLMDADGNLMNIVARFGGFLGFGETTVLLTPDEVTATRDADGKTELTTTLTPDALKDRPEYKPAK